MKSQTELEQENASLCEQLEQAECSLAIKENEICRLKKENRQLQYELYFITHKN